MNNNYKTTNGRGNLNDRYGISNGKVILTGKQILEGTMQNLEREYGSKIITKYETIYNEIINYTPIEIYRLSGYTGTFEEYARNEAKSRVMSLYKDDEFGGYMHIVVSNVLKKYLEDMEKRQKMKPFMNNNSSGKVERVNKDAKPEVKNKEQNDAQGKDIKSPKLDPEVLRILRKFDMNR